MTLHEEVQQDDNGLRRRRGVRLRIELLDAGAPPRQLHTGNACILRGLPYAGQLQPEGVQCEQSGAEGCGCKGDGEVGGGVGAMDLVDAVLQRSTYLVW